MVSPKRPWTLATFGLSFVPEGKLPRVISELPIGYPAYGKFCMPEAVIGGCWGAIPAALHTHTHTLTSPFSLSLLYMHESAGNSGTYKEVRGVSGMKKGREG